MKIKIFAFFIAVSCFIFLPGYKSAYAAGQGYRSFLQNKLSSAATKGADPALNIYSVIDSFNAFYSYDSMHYAEYNGSGGYSGANVPSGTVMDTEAGGLPGFGISYGSVPLPAFPLWYQANYSMNSGDSTYTSLLVNSSNQVTGYLSTTDHLQYINYGIRLGYALIPSDNFAIIPNAGYEWVFWNRNVTPDDPAFTNNVEHYRLDYWMAGLKSYYLMNSSLWIEGEAYYTHGINNEMAPSDEPGTASLGNKAGYLVGAKIGYILYSGNGLTVSPFIGIKYAQNQENASNRLPAYESGYIWWEPADQYNQLWINAGIKVGF